MLSKLVEERGQNLIIDHFFYIFGLGDGLFYAVLYHKLNLPAIDPVIVTSIDEEQRYQVPE